ncbi:lipoprotein [Afifella sp. IM 167]|uniref:LPS translocon maturation chaperone LptM n=1 Tax=Afifella sp. IM 167 TaxID=2033586 RepID=UPI001CCC1AAC|nr:lipoprotein [Afifella sp. IM 167]MBZ8132834.1 hypothetical protein [Afifella sp. IM 167]
MAFLRLVIVLTLAASAVTGCGRRGALEPPPGAENSIVPKSDPGAGPSQTDTVGNVETLSEEGRVAAETPTSAEEEKRAPSDPSGRRFILDPLI